MTDDFSETQASVLIGTAEKMIEIWNRLSPEKQAALLAVSAAKKTPSPLWSRLNWSRPPNPDSPVRQIVLLFHDRPPLAPLS